MSGLSKVYASVIQKQLNAYAAWFPITNSLEVGDYGLFEDGVFKPVGKIRQKFPDINVITAPGNKTDIDFKSDGTKITNVSANGSADAISAVAEVEAGLKISFSKQNSCLLKASITSIHMTNIDDVAAALSGKKSWDNRFKVVSAVYVGEKGTVMCALKAGTEITLKGKVNLAQQIEGGKVEGAIEIVSNNNSVFHSVGDTGVLAVELFKLNLFDKVKMLGAESKSFNLDKQPELIEDIE